ncbi:MAG: hypothetical protein KIT41_14315 [Pyrinomonadaceae bacterium]|nr:hypothetical protein [Pyrinomonadaceae bacterium]
MTKTQLQGAINLVRQRAREKIARLRERYRAAAKKVAAKKAAAKKAAAKKAAAKKVAAKKAAAKKVAAKRVTVEEAQRRILREIRTLPRAGRMRLGELERRVGADRAIFQEAARRQNGHDGFLLYHDDNWKAQKPALLKEILETRIEVAPGTYRHLGMRGE